MKAQHTKGPWQVDRGMDYISVEPVCKMIGLKPGNVTLTRHVDAQVLANARLISAAPDLLLALENLVNEILDGGYEKYMNESLSFKYVIQRTLSDAGVAIRKAKGEK